MKKRLTILMAALLIFGLCACANTAPASTEAPTMEAPAEAPTTEAPTEESYDGVLVEDGDMTVEYAKNFSIKLYKGGYRMITGGSEGKRFLVVPEGMTVPADLDGDVAVLQQPIDKMYVASANMMGLLDELDALSTVKLVATDVSGWHLPNIKAAMEAGSIAYSGKYDAPDFEMITNANIQLHVDTGMIDSAPEVEEKFDELGIPSLVENSSAESHPLGRIEWVKAYGVILGMEEEANALFEAKKEIYNACLDSEGTGITAGLGYLSTSGKGYARNGGDYLAQMIDLVGGQYIQKDMNPDKAGNVSMTVEEWYAMFKDADYLFYWNIGEKFYTIEEMIAYNPLFADFKSVQNGNVWITAPDWSQTSLINVMQDMYTIFHSGDGDVTTDHLIKIQ